MPNKAAQGSPNFDDRRALILEYTALQASLRERQITFAQYLDRLEDLMVHIRAAYSITPADSGVHAGPPRAVSVSADSAPSAE